MLYFQLGQQSKRSKLMGKFKDIDTELQEFKRQAEDMSQKDLIDDYAHLRLRESELEEQVLNLLAQIRKDVI